MWKHVQTAEQRNDSTMQSSGAVTIQLDKKVSCFMQPELSSLWWQKSTMGLPSWCRLPFSDHLYYPVIYV